MLRILQIIQYDASITEKQLAKCVGLSRESVNYRIKSLQQQRIITGYTAIVDTAKLGYFPFRIFLKVKSMSRSREEELLAKLHAKANWIVRCRGNWSYNLMMQVASLREAKQFLDEVKRDFDANIIHIHSSIITTIHHFSLDYLSENTGSAPIVKLAFDVGSAIHLDDTDELIIRELVEDAATSHVQLGSLCGVSERVIRYRLATLYEKGVLLGRRAIIDNTKLNLHYYKIHLTLSSTYNKKAITAFIGGQRGTVYITETIGGWDIEFEYWGISKDVYALIDDIEERFNFSLNDYEIIEYEKEFKVQYLP